MADSTAVCRTADSHSGVHQICTKPEGGISIELRAYRKRSGLFDPLPVSKPVSQGGWGSLELAFRYSRLDLTEGTVDGGDLEILSLGINWWFSRSTTFSLNYRHISLDRAGIQGNSSGLNARIQLILD